EVKNIKKVISPVLINDLDTSLIYIDFSKDKFNLGGSSFSQVVNELGKTTPTVKDAEYFKKTFNVVQELITRNKIIAGHDISAGGIITTLLEMTFGSNKTGLDIDFSELDENDIIKLLFSENPGIIIQVKDNDFANEFLKTNNIDYHFIGKPCSERFIKLKNNSEKYNFNIKELRDIWFKTSYLFDRKQCGEKLALERFKNYKNQELKYKFNRDFSGKLSQYNIDFNRRKPTGIKAAIIREKGVNGDREMAYSMHLAGFDVKDVHMTDLISGRETLEDINFIVFVGGFSNSDVLGSAKGWAGAFLYNEKARKTLENFYARKDTLSLGICNGCQLMVELDLIYPDHDEKPQMLHNDSHKFESAFINVDIHKNISVMLKSLEGSRLGIWVAHGEGKFHFPYEAEFMYNIP
ncbi:MAG: phosphoribosylformylglycinamidine synthase subunit PurQ, partial [Bacteroidales bacterium]|nr:phosphoribosylformylglycinamidine synthase subunit PurQ [Bacteroidales bacterium]